MALATTASGVSSSAGTTVGSSAFAAVAGNLIAVAAGTYENTAVVASVTDTAGNTYERVRADTHTFAGSLELWVAKNIAAHASNVVTVTFNASVGSARRVIAHQYSGRHLTAPVLAHASGGTTFGTSVTTGSFNPGTTGSDVFCGFSSSGAEAAGSHTAGAGYTKRVTVGSYTVSQDRIGAPNGGQTSSMSWTNNGDAILSAVALAEAPPEVKSVSGAPAAGFALSGVLSVIGTTLIAGTPSAAFALSGSPAAVDIKTLTGTIALRVTPAAEPSLPAREHIWGVPVDITGTVDLAFLGTREYGVFLEERGQPAMTFPVSGQFRLVSAIGEISGTINITAFLAGVPGIGATVLRELSGSPLARFALGGNPQNITTTPGDPFDNAAMFITTNPGGGPEPDWNNAATNIVVPGNLGDGVTDVTAQLQAYFDQAFNENKKVILSVPTGAYYRITSPLRLRAPLSTPGGRGTKVRIHTTNVSTSFTSQASVIIIPNGTGYVATGRPFWIKNVHLSASYTNGHPGTEDGHALDLGNVNGLTVRYCRLANTRGDSVGDRESLWTVSSGGNRNLIFRNNAFINPFRCAGGFIWHGNTIHYIDNYIDKDNAVDAGASFVSAFDIEPEVRNGVGGNVSNVEIAHNYFSMNNATVNPNRGADGKCIFRWQVSGNNNPGGNHYFHRNNGNGFGTGFYGSAGSFGSALIEQNVLGGSIPRLDPP